jgi:hypothetical protein
MNKREFEEYIYEYGHIMYRIGRMETDENSSTKEYNNMVKKKEELTKIFDEFFKTCIKF